MPASGISRALSFAGYREEKRVATFFRFRISSSRVVAPALQQLGSGQHRRQSQDAVRSIRRHVCDLGLFLFGHAMAKLATSCRVARIMKDSEFTRKFLGPRDVQHL